MSYCEDLGKDRLIFLSKEDSSPSTSSVVLPDHLESAPEGLIRSDGSINWGCPCLGGMAIGPCGLEFREAFSCFHTSEADPKGSDCLEAFGTMQECLKEYPQLYGEKESQESPDPMSDIQSKDDLAQSLDSNSESGHSSKEGSSEVSVKDK